MSTIVDHQVEHHVHVQAARTEQVQTVDLEKQGQGSAALQFDDPGIESLQVPHLQDPPVAPGGVDEAGRRGEVGRDGLLHEHVDSGVQQGGGDLFMNVVGVATIAASILPASSRKSVSAGTPYFAAISAARAASTSTTKAS